MDGSLKPKAAKRGRPRHMGGSPAVKKRRKLYDQRRNVSRICIGSAKEAWGNLRASLGIESNETFAFRLLDSFNKTKLTSTPTLPNLESDVAFEGTSVSSLSHHSTMVYELSQDVEVNQPEQNELEVQHDSICSTELQTDVCLQSLDFDNSMISVELPYEDDKDPSWCPEQVEFSMIQKDHVMDNLPTITAAETVFGVDDDDESDNDNEADNLEDPGTKRSIQKEDVTASSALCFFDNLITLAKINPPSHCKQKDCSSPIQLSLQEAGTAVHMLWKCGQGHVNLTWSSQPVLKRGVYLGNIMLCAAVVFSGNNYAKIEMLCRQLNLAVPSKHTFHRLQGKYIAPCIVNNWEKMQTDLLSSLEGKEVVIAGDGRNDSPGHCAQYCTYSVMDVHTSAILDMVIVDKRQTGRKSATMEERGFRIALDKLINAGVKVVEIITDAHSQISSTMKKSFPNIKHSFDIWHGSKNLGKKLVAAAQEKGCTDLLPWVGHVTNHFWYCARHCDGKVSTLLNKWQSTLHHTVGEHEWTLGKCEHDDQIDDHPEWLTPDSDAHRRLREVVYNPYFLRSLPYYVNFRSNSSLEVLNNHILMYASKRFSYRYPAYRARNLLAAMDFNHHKDRQERRNKEGDIIYKKSFSKYTNHFRVWPDKIDKDYRYLKDIMMDVVTMATESGQSIRGPTSLLEEDPIRISRSIAPVPVPRTVDILRNQKSRFSK